MKTRDTGAEPGFFVRGRRGKIRGMWSFMASYRYLLLACPVLAVVAYSGYRIVTSLQPPSRTSSPQVTADPPTKAYPVTGTGTLWNKFRQIKPEMTTNRLRAILGPPTINQDVFDVTLWIWRDNLKNYCFVLLFMGREEGKVWCKKFHPAGKEPGPWDYGDYSTE
jgi:hypothetical protein